MTNFSPDVLDLFSELLGMVTLNVGADDFDEKAETVLKARRELRDATGDKPPAADRTA